MPLRDPWPASAPAARQVQQACPCHRRACSRDGNYIRPESTTSRSDSCPYPAPERRDKAPAGDERGDGTCASAAQVLPETSQLDRRPLRLWRPQTERSPARPSTSSPLPARGFLLHRPKDETGFLPWPAPARCCAARDKL